MNGCNLLVEKDLLLRIIEDDKSAFRELFDLYGRSILSFVSDFIHSEDMAKEMVLETFLILWNNRKVPDEIGHPGNYIYTIARDKCHDYISSLARHETAMRTMWENTQRNSADAGRELLAKQSGVFVSRALISLSDQKQEVFRAGCYDEDELRGVLIGNIS